MAEIVVLGAGVSGHTAALHLRRMLGTEHKVTVVTPNKNYNWIPSNIWVGVGTMAQKKVIFPLAPIYEKQGINLVQAKATEIHPEGNSNSSRPYVVVESTAPGTAGSTQEISYDYLINATGPKLKFEATEGLGPDTGNSVSVCTADHAVHASKELDKLIAKAKKGKRQVAVVGMGNGTCTCEGAAFEYAFNVDDKLKKAGVRDKVELIYLTNEAELGDFGVGGMTFVEQGFETSSQIWTESLFRERNVKAILGAAVLKVEPNKVTYEKLDGEIHELAFDFAMLLPPFGGQPMNAYDKEGADISGVIFAPSGFMKVDADYTPKPYEEWRAKDWPRTYQSPAYSNMFAVGIAFAPPHQISRPRTSPNGTAIAPAPPRTGMPSGVMGKAAATTIARRIKKGANAPAENASMTEMGAACVASSGTGMKSGTAAAMTMMPVVPDFERYETGRDIKDTKGEIGLHGHWVKLMLHYLFIYKAKAKPFWYLIPE
ncbi:MAG: FAD-dependent oxidoreductase [Scrofimicrobium sp.]